MITVTRHCEKCKALLEMSEKWLKENPDKSIICIECQRKESKGEVK